MPNIKIQPRQQTIGFVPGTQMQDQDITPKIVDESAPWGALAKAGNAVADSANAMIKADRFVKMTTAKMELDTELDKVKADFTTRSDFQNFEKEYEEKAADIQKRYSEKYGDVWGQLQPFANNKIANAKIHVDYHGRKLWLDDARGKISTTVDELNKQYAYAEDPYLRQKKREEIDTILSDAVSTGIIGAAKKEEKMRALDNEADIFRVTTLIEQDPEVAFTYLNERNDSGGYKNFMNLTPKERGIYLKSATDEARSRKTQFFQDQNRYQDEVRYKVYDMLDDKSVSKSKTMAYIDQMTQPDPKTGFRGLDAREAFSLKEKIRKGDGGEEGGKTNYNTWKNLYERGLRGDLSLDDISNAWGNGISTADAKGLSTMITKAGQKEMTAQQKEMKTLLDTNMKDFSAYVKLVIGEGKNKTSKDLASAVIYDMQKVSEYVKDKKDLAWFENYQKEAVKTALDNNNKKYLKKMLERLGTSGTYEKMFEGSTVGKRTQGQPQGMGAPITTQSGTHKKPIEAYR